MGEKKGKTGLSWRRGKENSVWHLMLLPVAVVCVLGMLLLYGQLKPAQAEAQALPEVTNGGKEERNAPLKPAPLYIEKGQLLTGAGYQGDMIRKEVTEADLHHGFMVLVNYQWQLPEDYEPRDLVVANKLVKSGRTGFAASKTNMKLNATVMEKVQALADDAYAKDGIKGYLLGSTFRDFSYQTTLYRNKLNYYKGLGYRGTEAEEKAAFWVARPYTSEHHTGLAIDLPSRSHTKLTGSYGQTENGIWLAENAWKYGFVIRYAEEKSDFTQVGYEPWHIRYVGKPHSEILVKQGWCLEEYVDYIRKEGNLIYRCQDDSLWQIQHQKPTEEGYIFLPDLPGVQVSGDNIDGFILTIPLNRLAMEEDPPVVPPKETETLEEAASPEEEMTAVDEDPPAEVPKEEVPGEGSSQLGDGTAAVDEDLPGEGPEGEVPEEERPYLGDGTIAVDEDPPAEVPKEEVPGEGQSQLGDGTAAVDEDLPGEGPKEEAQSYLGDGTIAIDEDPQAEASAEEENWQQPPYFGDGTIATDEDPIDMENRNNNFPGE